MYYQANQDTHAFVISNSLSQRSTTHHSMGQQSTSHHTQLPYTISALQYSTVQYSTVQYITVQYSTVQYSTVQYSTVQYSTVQYSTLHYTTLHYTTLQYSNINPFSLLNLDKKYKRSVTLIDSILSELPGWHTCAYLISNQ